ncbi:hypothetical protein Desaci_2359 [Desulfosporosinus acidiphilus SJ4]|uniref:Uncharacterized protein n=1 Tax=Desulfosporosinus acidiphilus (strain DSM 22704 / JCM 16185 / SJ4) TaxID=646529 RepID=I4D688_DESAJ|nr:hypothetical protein [Desulfosporosinus acidiphilus]AFM41312.1 hypothetical protein Desaci_2359 [Desulfosporosinus acidiphilus SJ4]
METFDVTVNGSGFDPEYNFNNYALTLIFHNGGNEKTVRANLRYYPANDQWDLNPIFYEYSEDEKRELITQIVENDNFKTVFEDPTNVLM